MKARVLIIIIAVALAGLAAVFAARYLQDARSNIASESKPVKVLVAQEDIPRGTPADEMISRKMVVLQEVPRRFTSAGAVSTQKGIEGMVLATPLARGQQITAEQFEAPDVAGLAFSIPKQQLAVTIPVDEVNGVGGLVKPGDHIALYATFSPGPNGEKDLTKLLLGDTKVLAVGTALRENERSGGQQQAGTLTSTRSQDAEVKAPRTLTLSVAPADVERLVFAEETGHVWCALIPATTDVVPTSSGQTIRTVVQ
jgi:pilus assembly protein CpaB